MVVDHFKLDGSQANTDGNSPTQFQTKAIWYALKYKHEKKSDFK